MLRMLKNENIVDLKEAFKKEQESLPNTKCSKRLDV